MQDGIFFMSFWSEWAHVECTFLQWFFTLWSGKRGATVQFRHKNNFEGEGTDLLNQYKNWLYAHTSYLPITGWSIGSDNCNISKNV